MHTWVWPNGFADSDGAGQDMNKSKTKT